MSGPQEESRDRLWTGPFIRICLIYLLIFLGFHMLMATFAYYVIDIGGDEVTAGLVAGLFAISSVVIRPIMGWLLDNRGRRLLLLLGLAGLIVFPLTYAVCGLLTAALLLRLAHGLFWSASTTAANVAACDIIPPRRFGAGMGFFGLTSAVSTAVAPGIGLLLMNKMGFDVMFAAASGLALLALLLALGLRYQEPARERSCLKEGLKPSHLFDKTAFPAAATVFVFLLPYGAVTTFLALYASTSGLPTAGAFFFVMAATSAAARVLSGQLVDRRGEAPIVWFANGSMLAALLLLGWLPGNVSFFVAAVLFGAAFGVMPPAMQAMALRCASPQRRGAASSTYLCSFDIGMGLGGVIAGYLINWVGYNQMFALMGLAMLISAAVYFFWGRNHPSSFRFAQQEKI